MSDAGLDPTTADYIGQRITTLGNAVYLRLMTPLGTWWADPSLGSRLHELVREKDVPRVRILAEAYARQALQPLLDDGRATSVDVVASRPVAGLCLLTVEVVDAAGRRQVFEHPVPVA